MTSTTQTNSERPRIDAKDDWVLLGEGNLKGATLIVERASGEAVSLSTRSCRDDDRFDEVPDLAKYPSLEVLDLHRSRYITEFDASVCKSPKLKRLLLTRCDRLCVISPAIGGLASLTEVSKGHCIRPFVSIA